MSEETYLEAFIEGLSTLPNDVKRNMELIRDLDKTSATAMAQMRKLQQEYMYQAEQKMSAVQVVVGADGTTILGLQEDANLEPVFPSTAELFDFVNDAERYKQIKALQDECLQKADEKIAVAKQAMELIDAKVQRLDHDLSAMETLLQVTRNETTHLPVSSCSHTHTHTTCWIPVSVITGDRGISIWRGGQTQRHGRVSSHAGIGMDLGQGITPRCRHGHVQTRRRGY